MKYPVVLFFRWDKYKKIDEFIESNKDKFNCTLIPTGNPNDISKLFSTDVHVLITFGDTDTEYGETVLNIIADRHRNRWFHKFELTEKSIDELNMNVNYCYIHNVIEKRELTRPIFSIFTSCYNSYHKLYRAYNSIKKQTMRDWEWVILDDSPDDKHFEFLREISKQDKRIRLYKRDFNSGNIGNVKNETIGLCRGKYVLEMDHDDEILPDVLQDATNVFDRDEDVGFVYMETASIRENGENVSYGDFICKGYGGNYMQKDKDKDKWVVVYNTPNINNITLSHLVCLPNHPRIWRRSTLNECGSYSEFLPICDDYEIILRTCIKTKVAKIAKLGYFQYMNDNNNNFSLIRNSEINRIGPQFISPMFFDKYKVHDVMREKNGYEKEDYIWDHKQLWKRPEEYLKERQFVNVIVNDDYDKQYCILGTHTLDDKLELISELYKNERNDFIVLDNRGELEELQSKLDNMGFDRMKCYVLKDTSEYELVRYFKYIYQFKEDYELIYSNLRFRDSIINVLTEKNTCEMSYLEIGVEYGHTFNGVQILDKIGVDPDPKFEHDSLIKKTSDDFFAENTKMFDRIFIDGMHHSDYVVRDFNNSMKFLNKDGIIFIDDVLPNTEKEQQRIPDKHYYENGILKYGESWTGDVWKVVYYILRRFQSKMSFELHTSELYRGVGCFKIKETFTIPDSAVEEIQNYSYGEHFKAYQDLLYQTATGKYKYNLSVMAVFKNEGYCMREWIEHYLQEGVDHFYLINNNSSDNFMNVLDPYISRGLITLKNSSGNIYCDSEGHKSIYNNNVYQHRFETKWMILVDFDEFMYGRKDNTIKNYLETLDDDIGNIYVEWRFFTSNNNKTQPSPIINSLTKRVKYPLPENLMTQVYFTVGFGKSIFRSAWLNDITKFWMHKVHTDGKRIDSYGNELPNNFYDPDNIIINEYTEETIKDCNLVINHYVCQSKESLVRKVDDLDKRFVEGNHGHIQRKGFLVGCHYIESHPEMLIEDNELSSKRILWSDKYNKKHHDTYKISTFPSSVKNYGDFYIYENCGVCTYIRNGMKWEDYMHDVFDKYITNDSVVLEAGCHIGTHSIKLCQTAKEVHLIEPLKSSFEILEKNLEINNHTFVSKNNYNLYNNGAGEKNKMTSFAWIPKDNLGGVGLLDNPNGYPKLDEQYNSGEWFKQANKQDVEVITIDSLNLDKLDFIKMDVEGYEPYVIEGAMETIKRCRPVITMECFRDHEGNALTVEEVYETYPFIKELDYEVENIRGPDYLFVPKTNIHVMHRRFKEKSMQKMHERFNGNSPFDHIILEDMIDPVVLKKAEQEIRNDDIKNWMMHFVHGNADVQVNKYCKSNKEQCCIYMCGPYSTAISVYFSSQLFIDWIEQLTGIEELENDPENVGGGIHRITNGGKLDIHADYNRNPRSKKYRRVNVLLYLNEEWKPEFNGELELWNKEMTECFVSVPPTFNKMVIFRITDDAPHGHPKQWSPPFDYHRVSFAFYYFTDDRPEHEKSESYNAVWKKMNILPGKDPYARIKQNDKNDNHQKNFLVVDDNKKLVINM